MGRTGARAASDRSRAPVHRGQQIARHQAIASGGTRARGRDQRARNPPHLSLPPFEVGSHSISRASGPMPQSRDSIIFEFESKTQSADTARRSDLHARPKENGNHDLNPRQPGLSRSSLPPASPASPDRPPAVTPQDQPPEPDRSGDQCRPHFSRWRLDRRSARYRCSDVRRRLADRDADSGMAIARPTCLTRLKSPAAHAAPGRHR